MNEPNTNPSVKTKKNKPIPQHPLAAEYLSTDQLAVVLNTPAPVIRESRRTGTLFGRKAPEFCRIGERKLLYLASTIREWIESAPKGRVAGAEE